MDKKSVAWTNQAKADLRAIDQPTTLRILHTVARYLASGEGSSGSRFKGIAHKRSNRAPAREYFHAGKLPNFRNWHDDDPFHRNLWPAEYMGIDVASASCNGICDARPLDGVLKHWSPPAILTDYGYRPVYASSQGALRRLWPEHVRL
jgi:hypothetical protein